MKNILFLLAALALGGCTSLNSISTTTPVYEKTTRGHFDDYPYCVVERLERHHSWRMTGLRYDVRVNNRRQTTQVTSAAKADQNWGVFVMDVRQTGEDRIDVKLRGKARQYEVKEAIAAANSCLKTASRAPLDLSELK